MKTCVTTHTLSLMLLSTFDRSTYSVLFQFKPKQHLIAMSLPTPSTNQVSEEQQLKLDAPLIALAQQCNGDIRTLLYSFFSFLHRKTDYYCIPNEQDKKDGVKSTMGFPEGEAEKLLLAAFRQFPLRRMPSQKQLMEMQRQQKVTQNAGSKESYSNKISHADTQELGQNMSGGIKQSASSSASNPNTVHCEYTQEGNQIPIGNGGVGKLYSYHWTQTLQEVTIAIPLPNSTKSKDLDVEIKPGFVVVRHDQSVLFQGQLRDPIRTDESTWTIESNVLLLSMEKASKSWWNKILVEEEEMIDTDLLDKTHKISDYDEATQGMIRKILFDQRQERLGLPTSNEILEMKEGEGNGLKMEKLDLNDLPPGVEYFDKHNFPPSKSGVPNQCKN